MLANLRVFFVAGTLEQGGAERQLYYMVQTLIKHDAVVCIATVDGMGFWGTRLAQLGATVVDIQPSRPRWLRFYYLWRQLRLFQPDIVQSQHFFVNGYAAGGARLVGAHSIGAIRGTGKADITEIHWIGAKLGIHLPHLLAANSQPAIDYFVEIGVSPKKLFLLPNVVDTNQFSPAATNSETLAESATGEQDVHILAVGRLIKQKRFDRLIEVVNQLRHETSVSFHVKIVGDGPEHSDLEQRINADIQKKLPITLCGKHADVLPYYHWADILISTSDGEGTPNVILEAMACGLPIVATNVGGIKELVRSGEHGFTIDDYNLPQIKEKLRYLIENKAVRDKQGHQAQLFIIEKFSVDTLASQFVQLYDQLRDRRHHA